MSFGSSNCLKKEDADDLYNTFEISCGSMASTRELGGSINIGKPRNTESISSTSMTSDTGELYPDPLLSSCDSRRSSVWMQYSLINKSIQSRTKQDLCTCCNHASFRHTTLKAIFILVVGFGLLLSCLAIRYSTYAPQYFTLTGGDQTLVPISTYFNKQIQFERRNKHKLDDLVLYILPDVPVVSGHRVIYDDAVKFHIPSWSYQYWGLYLLAGTEVTISICADLHLQFYIIKSQKKLKEWKQTTLFYRYDFHTNIHPKQNCTAKKNFKTHLVKVAQSDVYYILFSSSVGWRFITEITVLLQFNRTYYDITKYKQSCIFSNKSCKGDLNYASNDIALLQAMSNTSQPSSVFHTYDVTFSPLPRWNFYYKLFGFIHLAIIASTMVYSLWRCCLNLYCRSPSSFKEERRPLIIPSTKPYSYSLQSTAGKSQDTNEERYKPPVKEGLVDDFQRKGHSLSIVSNESASSLFTRQESTRHDMMARQRQLMDDQQLLDSVMTTAGVSAI